MSRDDTTKRRIMLAAGPIFAHKGYRGATVREICDSAGVNLASINYYFGDKHHLYIETVFMAREMRAQQVPFPVWSAGTDAEQKLRDFIELLLNRMVAMQKTPWQVRLLIREIIQPTEACKQLVEEYFRPIFEKLMEIIDEIVGFQLPEATRYQLGFSIIGQCLHYRFSAGVIALMIDEDRLKQEFELDQLRDHIAEFSLGALRSLRENPGPYTEPGMVNETLN